MSLLKQDTIWTGRVNKILKLKLDKKEDKEYEIEIIRDSTIYNKVVEGQLPSL